MDDVDASRWGVVCYLQVPAAGEYGTRYRKHLSFRALNVENHLPLAGFDGRLQAF